MILRRNALAAFLVLGLTAPAQAATPPRPGTPLDQWHGGPVVDAAGNFAYCVVENRFDNDVVLVVARNGAGEANLALGLPGAELEPGQTVRLALRIDDRLRRDLTGHIVDPELMVIETGRDTEFYEGLRRGRVLTIQGPTDSVAFQLTGTARALAELATCVTEAQARGPVAVPPPLPEPLMAVLARAGLEVVPFPIDRTAGPRVVDFAWRLGPVFGGMVERRAAETDDFETLSTRYVADLAERCAGEFRQQLGDVETLAVARVRTADATCRSAEGTIHVALLLYLTDTRLFTVFFHEAAAADRVTAEDARNALARVIRELAQQSPGAG